MNWFSFWAEYPSFIAFIGNILNSFPPIIIGMVTAPLLFALMYGFVHMVRGLRE